MAYVESTFRANDGSGPMGHYFNLTEAVGNGCPNRLDDVALTQTFLQSLSNLPESPVQGGTMHVDGLWTPQLGRGIALFQKLARRGLKSRGASEVISVDGLILPARGVYVEGTLQMYTIIALNKAYAHYYWHDYVHKWPLQRAQATRKSSVGELVD
mgnify:CR=1 FL=1